jgi:hypothetical protein
MVSSGMLHRAALVRTDVSEELSASFIRVTRIGELGTTLALTSNRRTLRKNTKVLPKPQFLQEPHGVTSQKTPFFNFEYVYRSYQGWKNAKGVGAIPVTVCGSPHRCETPKPLLFLDQRLTYIAEDVSLTRRPTFNTAKIPATKLRCEPSRPQRHRTAGRIRPMEKSNGFIENRTRDLTACNHIAPT